MNPEGRGAYRPWAELIRRTFGIDPLECPGAEALFGPLSGVRECASPSTNALAVRTDCPLPSGTSWAHRLPDSDNSDRLRRLEENIMGKPQDQVQACLDLRAYDFSAVRNSLAGLHDSLQDFDERSFPELQQALAEKVGIVSGHLQNDVVPALQKAQSTCNMLLGQLSGSVDDQGPRFSRSTTIRSTARDSSAVAASPPSTS